MYKRLFVALFLATVITACNPKEPKINRVKEEIEEMESDCFPKEMNYGPTPGG